MVSKGHILENFWQTGTGWRTEAITVLGTLKKSHQNVTELDTIGKKTCQEHRKTNAKWFPKRS